MKKRRVIIFLISFSVMLTLSCGLVGAKDFVGGEFIDSEETENIPPLEEIPPLKEDVPPIEEPPVTELPNVEPSEEVIDIPNTEEEIVVPAEPNAMLLEVSKIRIAVQILVFGLIPIFVAVWIIKNIILGAFKRFF